MNPVTVDFETFGIEPRPDYPPKSVGVAIKWPGKAPVYADWGHPGSDGSVRAYAERLLAEAWAHPGGVLFHNAKFDLEVARVHFGLEPPKIVHDTMIELFLADPHQPDLHLKPASERLLKMPPEERDAVADWLVAHQPVSGKRITRTNFGAYIALAPASVVGPYACGDVERTARLHDLLHPGMGAAYQREIELLRVIVEMERQGVPVDHKNLYVDTLLAREAVQRVDDWIRRNLNTPDLNIDSAAELVEALDRAGKIDRALLPRTATGKESTTKDAMNGAVTDRTMMAVLRYRREMLTCLRTFMEPWLVMADKSGGLIYTSWHQTRGLDGGTRTGRLSSSPNFQNIPKEFKPIFDHEAPNTGLPKSPVVGMPIPNVRKYIVPGEGRVLVGRDYSQQELRILAHYMDDDTLDIYRGDPWTDFHQLAHGLIEEKTGKKYERKAIKIANFSTIYGAGVGRLAEAIGCTVEEATELKNALLAVFPGLPELQMGLKNRARNGLPIRTWGGREYYCEPSKVVNGRTRTFDYKLLNVLIQGSAADCTKEAVIRYWKERPESHTLLLTVHDELLCSCPSDEIHVGQMALKEAMESVVFDLPMLSEGYYSEESWAGIEDYDKKGRVVYGGN